MIGYRTLPFGSAAFRYDRRPGWPSAVALGRLGVQIGFSAATRHSAHQSGRAALPLPKDTPRGFLLLLLLLNLCPHLSPAIRADRIAQRQHRVHVWLRPVHPRPFIRSCTTSLLALSTLPLPRGHP